MNAFEKILQALGAVKPTTTLSPIHAGHGNLLFDSSGGAISVIHILGALRRFEGVERDSKLRDFERYLATWNSRRGYYMTFIHEHSEDGLNEQIERSHKPMQATMDRLQMNSAKHMLSSREKYLEGKLHYDTQYLVLHTTTGVLPVNDIKAKDKKRMGALPGQSAPYYAKLHDLHANYLDQILGMLKQLSIQFIEYDARQSAALIGTMWTRKTVQTSNIRLVDDHVNQVAKEIAYKRTKTGFEPIFSLKDFASPSLSNQLFQDKVYFPAKRDDYFVCNGVYQSALRMTQSPGSGSVRKYNELRSRLPPDTNYRFSIQLASGSNPDYALSTKRMMAIMTGNVHTAKSIDELKKIADAGVVTTGVKISCATWAGDVATLERNVEKLQNAFQFWGGSTGGGAKLTTLTDQPDAAVAQTLPGAIQRGATTFLPLGIVSEILPLEIATSPWRQGLIMRSGEDQAYPLDPAEDSLVDFHVYVLIGAPGKGKSVAMTDLAKACLFRNGMEKLPYLRYLDVGYTSKALFTYLRYMLPDSRKHEIVHYTIQNTSDYCLNGFDTPLGMRSPPAKELSFLCDTIGSYLAGSAKEGMAAATLTSLGNQLVSEAYRLTSDGNALCKTYHYPDDNQELAEFIERHQLPFVSGVTQWYTVTDTLFELGEPRLAQVAQRYAVPTIMDLLSVMARSTSISESFKDKMVDGTDIISYARTILQSMIQRYPALCGITRLDIEGARMVGIDTQDVAQSAEETGLFYMMLQNVLSRGFMSQADEVPRMKMPPQYRDYHRKRILELRSSQRLFAFDELHRLSQGLDPNAPMPKAMALLMQWIKEVRKYGIKLLLSTQAIEHMPSEIKEDAMWSMFFCMGLDAIPAQRKVTELFDISEYGQSVLKRLHGPEAGVGARCLFLANSKHGRIEQELFITTSPFELWAAPTKAANLELMELVTEQLNDPVLAARALADVFPKGTAESEHNRLQVKEELTESEAKAHLLAQAVQRANFLRRQDTSNIAV